MEVCDVDADGDCLYRCLLCCLRGDPEVCRELSLSTDGVTTLRSTIAQSVRENLEVRKWLRTLLRLHKQTEGGINLTEDNPLLAGARSLTDVAENITTNRVWASQVEVNVARLLVAPFGIAIVVVEGASDSAADQLLAALNQARMPRCIVLVRVNQCHYRFLRLRSITIFCTAWLIYKSAHMAMTEDKDSQLF